MIQESQAVAAPPKRDVRYQCGTLVYTKAGLFTLFVWLLWGDFCFTLMEAIWPNVLPLLLKSEGAPNMVTALAITTVPQLMNFVLNPIISTISDRYRSKLGRRIPFLLFSAPFITLFLILMGFSRELGRQMYSLFGGLSPHLTPAMMTVGLICVLIVCFRFFELFVATIFYYLFNDVVPTAFMGRFLGLFRAIGCLAGALFNFFLFKYAESHASIIFLGGAFLYGTAFLLMCLNVREGTYPEPDENSKRMKAPLAAVKIFFAECFRHRIFRRLFAYSALAGASGSINIFMIFMAFSIGLTIDQVGKVAGVSAVVAMLLMYPMGALVDRFHPLRVTIVAQIAFCTITLLQCIFLFYEFPKNIAFWTYASLAGISIPVLTANTAASLPLVMRLFPNERFGQFCAANAMCSALGISVAGVLAGVYLDTLKRFFASSGDYYYRFVPAWSFFFMALASVMSFLV
ncbi:MAG TPA: MFS transporter, partial [Terrimicrobiaceae bacterium]|nr:MFS transporter [Terrimicrobiaceae bacterium]